jgi:hypothetical protein
LPAQRSNERTGSITQSMTLLLPHVLAIDNVD